MRTALAGMRVRRAMHAVVHPPKHACTIPISHQDPKCRPEVCVRGRPPLPFHTRHAVNLVDGLAQACGLESRREQRLHQPVERRALVEIEAFDDRRFGRDVARDEDRLRAPSMYVWARVRRELQSHSAQPPIQLAAA